MREEEGEKHKHKEDKNTHKTKSSRRVASKITDGSGQFYITANRVIKARLLKSIKEQVYCCEKLIMTGVFSLSFQVHF